MFGKVAVSRMPLNTKQKLFVAEYLVDLNATQAAIRAGYSKHTAMEQGCRLLKHPGVSAALAVAMEKRVEQVEIDAAWVLKRAVELHDAAMIEKAFAAAKGALELVGKHIDVQAFKDRVEHGGRVEYTNMSDEELDARIAALINPSQRNETGVTTH